MFGAPREQKPAWTPPRWAIPVLLVLGIGWGIFEVYFFQNYFFGGAGIVLAALAGYELYKTSGDSASEDSSNASDRDSSEN